VLDLQQQQQQQQQPPLVGLEAAAAVRV
jgi:hypothetical protein